MYGQLPNMLGWLLKNYTTVEVEFVAVERVDAYASLPREGCEEEEGGGHAGILRCTQEEHGESRVHTRHLEQGFDQDSDCAIVTTAIADGQQPAGTETRCWSAVKGVAVELEGLRLSYGPGEPDVLHSIDMLFPAGSRVALVGRTGCGTYPMLRRCDRRTLGSWETR